MKTNEDKVKSKENKIKNPKTKTSRHRLKDNKINNNKCNTLPVVEQTTRRREWLFEVIKTVGLNGKNAAARGAAESVKTFTLFPVSTHLTNK